MTQANNLSTTELETRISELYDVLAYEEITLQITLITGIQNIIDIYQEILNDRAEDSDTDNSTDPEEKYWRDVTTYMERHSNTSDDEW